jgi:hypothetical protein
MDFKGIWLIDPTTKQPSVSLTLLVISFTSLLIASGLHLKHLTDNTSSLLQAFVTCAGLYFGRRFNKNGDPIPDNKENE